MRYRVVLLSRLVPSITPVTVWSLPVWAWRQYVALHDDYVDEARRADQAPDLIPTY